MIEDTLFLVYARAANGAIGKDGELPWHIPADLKHFKALTTGKVMGSKPPSRVVEVPHNGRVLSGDALAAQLRTWTEYGCAEPGVESAIASLTKGGVRGLACV